MSCKTKLLLPIEDMPDFIEYYKDQKSKLIFQIGKILKFLEHKYLKEQSLQLQTQIWENFNSRFTILVKDMN